MLVKPIGKQAASFVKPAGADDDAFAAKSVPCRVGRSGQAIETIGGCRDQEKLGRHQVIETDNAVCGLDKRLREQSAGGRRAYGDQPAGEIRNEALPYGFGLARIQFRAQPCVARFRLLKIKLADDQAEVFGQRNDRADMGCALLPVGRQQ